MSDESKKSAEKAPAGKARKKQKPAPQQSAANMVQERRNFYLNQLKWTKIAALVTSASALLLVCLGVFFMVTSKTTVYFQVDDENRIVSLVPLSQPKHSDAFVSDWLNKCMVKTYDFYYGNMDRHLQSLKGECYNDDGFQSLMNGLRSSGNYEAIKSKELFSSFTFSETPTVVRRKQSAGAPYKWMLQGEGILTLRTTTRTYPNKAVVTAIVTRSSLLDDNIGLSIEKVLIKTSRIGN